MKTDAKKIDKEELERRKKSMKILRTLMIILDVLALILLIVQILIKDISYWSYVILILCNILVFTIKINTDKKSN